MNVGDYVRYIDVFNTIKIRKINKIIPPDEFIKEEYYYFNDKEGTFKKNIIKSSPNIIDLIEEGDILKVNDFKDVYTIYEVEMFRNPYTNEKYLGIRNDISKRPKRLYEIPLVNLSIVTHEQFSQMEYKVGD